MTCPRCSVAEINADTGQCELCGYVSGGVALDAHPGAETAEAVARRELAHQFRLTSLIGQGVASLVYDAQDTDAGQRVALKVLKRTLDADTEERLQRDIEVAATLDHPHLVPVQRFGMTDSLFWYSTAHTSVRPLRAILRNSEPMPLRVCLRIANQLASALDHLHRRGIVHGNVKPENVLVDADYWVRLADVGMAAALETGPPSRATGHLLRPPAYLAPEDWLDAERSPASDQYALAVLLHECLTHAIPFAAGASDAARSGPPPLSQWRTDLPAHVEYALRRALSARPQDRFPSVLDFVAAMEMGSTAFLKAAPTAKRSSQVILIPGTDQSRRRLMWLALAAFTLFVYASWDFTRPPPPQFSEGWAAIQVQRPAEERRPEEREPPINLDPRERNAGGAAARRSPAARGAGDQRAGAERPQRPAAQREGPAAAQSQAPVEPGLLFVNSTPWGQLYIDGQLIGNTPRANLRLAPGAHQVRILREGYQIWERNIEIAPGQTLRLTGIALTPDQ
jgi:serine/threonine protein kinase